GQLDLDRLDYLNRDSFFSGVSEGTVSSERIIKLLNVKDGNLVVEEKGIYSVEKFLIARRVMYWQVYLHKTVIAGEQLLVKILQRARELAQNKVDLFATPALRHFLYNEISGEQFVNDSQHLSLFAQLDDHDITTSIKVWQQHEDIILSTLCSSFINRRLYKVEISNEMPDSKKIENLKDKVVSALGISRDYAHY